jgi:NAD(P) transhydrogenase subunit alpha
MTGMVALYIFMLAAFTGYEVISRVPVILHTPLMSGSNFVHGIVLVGAMVALGNAHTTLEKVIGVIGVLLAAGNAVGGYVVTERMLEMFKASGARGAVKKGGHWCWTQPHATGSSRRVTSLRPPCSFSG